jgi:Fe-S-cluster containining protein
MQSLLSYISSIYESTRLPPSLSRRQELVREMQELEGKTIHCFTCPGTCCTQAANSMLITPIEALEILASLETEKFTFEEMSAFKKRLLDTIQSYRLNIEIYTGKKNAAGFRKTYTCPFFNNGALGCSLSRASKPYGCLGFNPKISDDNGKSCSSNVSLLENRDNTFLTTEDIANNQIRKDLNLYWSKQNIPQALLDVLEKIEN